MVGPAAPTADARAGVHRARPPDAQFSDAFTHAGCRGGLITNAHASGDSRDPRKRALGALGADQRLAVLAPWPRMDGDLGPRHPRRALDDRHGVRRVPPAHASPRLRRCRSSPSGFACCGGRTGARSRCHLSYYECAMHRCIGCTHLRSCGPTGRPTSRRRYPVGHTPQTAARTTSCRRIRAARTGRYGWVAGTTWGYGSAVMILTTRDGRLMRRAVDRGAGDPFRMLVRVGPVADPAGPLRSSGGLGIRADDAEARTRPLPRPAGWPAVRCEVCGVTLRLLDLHHGRQP